MDSPIPPLKCSSVVGGDASETHLTKPIFDPYSINPDLIQKMAYDALVWSSLHGLVFGDRNSKKSGKVPGVGLTHAPVSLLPMPFPKNYWKQACEVAPIFNELADRVSLDGKFLQESLSRTKKVDAFTSRLLDIHAKMLDMNKKEEIWLGLHSLDYMLDEQTNLLLQIELNTISSSFPRLSCLVGELHGDGEAIPVVYFRAGYAPTDYPSESEWRARLLMEQSCAIKCASIAYHLAGTKKIQQELANPNILERFLENKVDIAKVRKCFAGLWSLDDPTIIKDAIDRHGLYVMKPQRGGGGSTAGDKMLGIQVAPLPVRTHSTVVASSRQDDPSFGRLTTIIGAILLLTYCNLFITC